MAQQGKLEGLVALVTGASSGMGKAAAIAFSKEGAKVRVCRAAVFEVLFACAECVRLLHRLVYVFMCGNAVVT